MLRRYPKSYGWLDRWFDIGDIRRVDNLSELCPCAILRNHLDMAFDSSIQDVVQRPPYVNVSTLQLRGYFQSWKYALAVEDQLRRSFRWKANITSAVRR